MRLIGDLYFGALLFITVVIWFIASYKRLRYSLHMMQLEGYDNRSYKKWIREFNYKVYLKRLYIGQVLLFAMLVFYFTNNTQESLNFRMISYTIVWSALMVYSIDYRKDKPKKELIYTARAKRLLTSNIIVNTVYFALYVLVHLFFIQSIKITYPIILFIGFLVYFFIPNSMVISNILVAPIEKRINKHYFDMAYNRVRSFKKLKVIGITGSYGKTSTKFITSKILEKSKNVIKSPESYNTTMGLSKVINDMLNEENEVFIAEMGARNKGDIEELARLANPHIGIITSIGPAHLDTFKDIENIMKTKYELIEALPHEGIAIFNYDNEYVRKLADKTFKEKILYGMEDIELLDVYATDIEVKETGSIFTLNIKGGNRIRCRTKLLGKHNISNILAGASAGIALGIPLEEIAKGIERVEPIPHRLQLLNPGTGVIVIDDAFNSNPIGSRAALEVLGQFKEGRKIIITPGMVELGEEEEKENEQFGRNIAEVCDYVILVGENRTKPIYNGIIDKGFNKQNIFVVKSLDEATVMLQHIVRPKDIVLFENDLPDTYNE